MTDRERLAEIKARHEAVALHYKRRRWTPQSHEDRDWLITELEAAWEREVLRQEYNLLTKDWEDRDHD